MFACWESVNHASSVVRRRVFDGMMLLYVMIERMQILKYYYVHFTCVRF